MPIRTGYLKVHTNTRKRYQRQQKYNSHHCYLGHVPCGPALLASVCIFMLPMLGLAAEHVQLRTTYYMINWWSCHVTLSHASLVLPSLDNVLPAMVLQNRVLWLTRCPLSNSGLHVYNNPAPIISSDLITRLVGVVLVLLLMLSGDIETNPGPVGEFVIA